MERPSVSPPRNDQNLTTAADTKPWWEQAAEKRGQKDQLRLKLKQTKNDNPFIDQTSQSVPQSARDLTPQPQKNFLKRKAN